MKEETRMTADLMFINGKVITVDQDFSIREAVAIARGKIVAVGSTTEISALRGAHTRVIDLKGKTLLPGINDPHLHAPFFGATRPPLALDLTPRHVSSIVDMISLLSQKAKTTQPGEWIRGFGWDQGALAECKDDPSRMPRKWDIDPVSPDHPVIFTDFSGHNVLVNSKAMEIAGITKSTPDPSSGEMERNPNDGEPTGILKELGAQSLISGHVPLLSREEKKQALLNALDHFKANGITSFTDAAIGPGGEKFSDGVMSAEFIDIYKELLDEEKLTARVNILLLLGDYGALTLKDLQHHMTSFKTPKDVDHHWLKFPGIKIFADGIPPTMTAWMSTPYLLGGTGSLVIPGKNDDEKSAALKEMINYIDSKGYQIGIHATGDRAIDVSIDGFVEAEAKNGEKDLRHYIIHADFISEEKARVLAKHGFGLAMQPSIKSVIADFAPNIVGDHLAAYQMPIKMAMDCGVVVTSSSDAPVTYPDWRKGVQAAVLRKGSQSGVVSGPEHRISVEQAIRSYTINGAWQDHMENIKGSIEVNKLADICIIDQDILCLEPDRIEDVKVLMTVVGGNIVYESD
jgi:predicted amidohydrolase YtcJ